MLYNTKVRKLRCFHYRHIYKFFIVNKFANIKMDDLTKQVEEIEVLTAIYGKEWQAEDEENRAYSISIADNGNNYVKLYVKLPDNYPSTSPPIYEISAPHLNKSTKLHLSNLLEDMYLSYIGQTVLFQWIEKIREELQIKTENLEDNSKEIAHCESELVAEENKNELENSDWECPEITHGEVINDRKSTFQGHAAIVMTAEQVHQVLQKLLANKKIAHATHNMYAYRIYSETTKSFIHDCDDDGEAQAGSRLLHFLQIINAKNVVVVVSRWYGGIHLGPDRFRHINNAARQVLIAANLMPDNKTSHK